MSAKLTVTGSFTEDTNRQERKKNYTTKKSTQQAKIDTKNRKQIRKIKYSTL